MYQQQESLGSSGFIPWSQDMWQSCVPSSQYDDIPRVYPNYPPTKSHNTRSKAASSKKSSTKKMRKSTNQLQVLRNYFQTDPKPGREPVLKLAATTGLNFYEVRNWFRNARLRNKDGMDDKKFDGKSDDSDSYGEVSSSTENSLSASDEILRMWTHLDENSRLELLPKLFLLYESNSNERYEAIKSMLRMLSTRERSAVHSYVKPRGPYRCSGDKTLSKTTVLERAKDAWYELERRFGANKNESQGNENSFSLNLDNDMLEGLRSLFQAHRDYLHVLAKEMCSDTLDSTEPKARVESSKMDMLQPIPQMPTNSLEMMPSYPYSSPTTGSNSLCIPAPIRPGEILYPGTQADYIPYQMQPNTAQHYPATNSMQTMMNGPFNRMLFSNGPPPSYNQDTHFKPYYPSQEDNSSAMRPGLAFTSPDRLSLNHVQKEPFFKGFPDMGNMGSQLAFNNYSTAPVLSDNSEITQNIYMYKMEVKVNNKGNSSSTSHSSQMNNLSNNSSSLPVPNNNTLSLTSSKELIEPPVL